MKHPYTKNRRRDSSSSWQKVFFSLLLVSITASAALAQETTGSVPDTHDEEENRYKAMGEEINKLIMQREKIMEDAMYEFARKKNTSKISLPPSAWYIAQNPIKKSNGGLNRFFNVQNMRNSLDAYFESETEERKIASAATPAHRKRLLFEESLETDFKGSIYHPNLTAFDINLENGLRQTRENFQPNLTGKLKNSNLNRFHILTSFLRKKPYAFSLSADKSREIENREFFERQIVNSTKYGGNFDFKNTVLPASFSFHNSLKTIDRASRPSEEFKDDELSLNLSNDSGPVGQTSFEFTQDTFSRTESGTPDQTGTLRDFNLSNHAFLAGDEKKMLNSNLQSYNVTGTSKNRVLNLNETLDITHTDRLTSSYAYSFSDKSSSGVNTRDNRVSASVRHRLYDSLTSSLTPYYFNSNSDSFSQDVYGAALSERYEKKLGRIGKLSSDIGLAYSEEKRKTSDTILSIIDEPHILTTGILTFLDKPRVDTTTVVVSDTTGTITYSVTADYLLTGVGEQTQIQRVPGGGIANGQEVLVDYRAQSSPSLTFNTLEQNFGFRLDFLQDIIGVFYRLNRVIHPRISGGEDFVTQTLDDTTIGLDFRYKNLSVELTDEDYDSSLSPYKQQRLRESFFFNPTEKSTLTFDSSQCKVILTDTQDTQKFFDFVTRYSVGLSTYSRLNAEAGFRWQTGTGIDLNDITAGAGYELNFRKFLLNLSYDYRRQLYLDDKLINHFFSFKIKRIF